MFAITRSYEQDDPAEPLPTELLHDLRQLVTCDVVCASGQDTPRWEFFADQTFSYFEVPAAEVVNRPGSDGGSSYWIPTPAGSACWAT